MSASDILWGLALGIGLSAACGFRVFVPLLLVSASALSGWVPLTAGFAWLGTWPALTALAVATLAEVGAYYVPWLDHLLDGLAAPAAIVAGTVLTAAHLADLDPLLKWTLALVAGGGTAGVVQGLTTALRGVSTATTGGFANPLFATAELGGSIATAWLALLVPIAVAALVLAVMLFATVWLWKRRSRRAQLTPGAGVVQA